MAKSKGIRVEGADQLRRQLAELPERIRKAARAAIADAAAAVQADAQAEVPVESGALRAGIQTRITGDGLSAEVGVFDRDLYYGAFIEFGTSSIPARPFMTPAAEAERAELSDRIRRATKGRLT